MVWLGLARLAVAVVPFGRWRRTLGGQDEAQDLQAARQWAAHVERAAGRLPIAMRCLPRAVALSWMLRRRAIGHRVVIAVRPADRRADNDALHAWVEVAGKMVLGELPGPWQPVFVAGTAGAESGPADSDEV
jgi:hypothetical protein